MSERLRKCDCVVEVLDARVSTWHAYHRLILQWLLLGAAGVPVRRIKSVHVIMLGHEVVGHWGLAGG